MRLLILSAAIFLPASILAQVQDPPQWSPAASYAAGGLVRASDGNFYRALRQNTAQIPQADPHFYWELYYVRANTTLTVAASGARYSSLRTAFAMVSSATIATTATVTIRISTVAAPYSETFTTPFSLDALSGKQIFIQGDNSAKISLAFSGSNGFQLDQGHTLAWLSSVQIHGALSYTGLLVSQRSTLLNMAACSFNGFGHAIAVNDNSYASALGCMVTNCSYLGMAANDGSHLVASNSTITGLQTSFSIGVQATQGATVVATGTTCTKWGNGFFCTDNATINAQGAVATQNGSGFFAQNFGFINANGSTSQKNQQFGYACTEGGRILAMNTTAGGNTSGDFSPAPNTMDTHGDYIQH